MGIVRKPDVQMYWSTEPSVETPFFSDTMPKNRFLQIMQGFSHDTFNFSNDDIERGKRFTVCIHFNEHT